MSQPSSGQPPALAVAAAYEVCKKIAKREAKNFYYSFRVLPRHKRLAMCAIYAFMRRADDIADDETHTVEERRTMMAAWLKAWRASTTEKGDPVFVAVRDTQARFNIGDDLLEELVQGTSMDLAPSASGNGETPVYLDFAELYRYCYLVASVVGLVCIRIFGYSDLRAERLAEETGIAFQLTNIIRDVKEDAQRNRVYLPLDLLAKYSSDTNGIRAIAEGERLMPSQRAMLRSLGEKAELFYASADDLLPLIDRDSRAALWVLVTIYRNLLRRIAHADYDVFTRRVSLPTASKLLILAEGIARGVRNRVLA